MPNDKENHTGMENPTPLDRNSLCDLSTWHCGRYPEMHGKVMTTTVGQV